MRLQSIFISALLIATLVKSYSQDRCATTQVEEIRHQKNPKLETAPQFEQWMKQNLLQPKLFQRAQRTGSATYSIPVVVHIIHNGEPIGSGVNISDAQIISQINVMNKDFQRLNVDQVNTPAEFSGVAASLDIEFVLAKQDPIGAPTNGIRRINGNKAEWSINENATFKALSYWPAEDYFNIWVVNLTSFLGFAQFPVSNLLPGLENSPDARLTDGIIIDYQVFGSIDDGAFNLDPDYNKGRTATHEAGHFFGLRHIWGDENCGNDFVSDTPTQRDDTNSCAVHPQTTNCGGPVVKMFQNYMDYTDDACMNLFTQGQVGRMITVLENSPRRVSLLNSDGDEPPPALALDLAIRTVIAPVATSCGGSVTPVVEIQNLGTSTLTSARIQLKINSVVTETKDFSLTLSNLQVTNVSFTSALQNSGSSLYEFEVLLVNGATDERPGNNTASVTSTVATTATLPITESFNTFPAGWSRYNPDNNKTWEIRTIAGQGSAMYVNCFDYENEGAVDRLITPILDLTNEPVALLKFDRAHAVFNADNQERLRVLVSTVCDFNSSPIEIFNKAGNALATAPSTTAPFTPTAAQWQTESLSLNQFVGSKIQVAFEVVNGWGNDVFLDNVVVLTDEFLDLAIVSMESPGPVTCLLSPAPVVRIKNQGSTTITSFKIQPAVKNQNQPMQTISGISLTAGAEQNFTLADLALTSGENQITFTVSDPNGLPDGNILNNAITVTRHVNSASDIIPLRENFNEDYLDRWPVVSQNNEAPWIPFATNKGRSVAYNSYSNSSIGDESWIVSPVLDFSKTLKASMFFDLSYAKTTLGNERLRILYSEDCGQTYPFILYDSVGASLFTHDTLTNFSWIPTKENHWKTRYLNLNTLAGKDQLRFAFVATNGNGNNLYIDNVEFFIDDNRSPVSIDNLYEAYGVASDVKLTFNLQERQPVLLKIYNMVGQQILENELPETLNQTYSFDLGLQGSGIYIVWVQFGNRVGASKVFIDGK